MPDEEESNVIEAVEEESNVIEPVEETSPSNNSSSVPKRHASLSKSTNDPDMKKDAKFLEKFQEIMTDASTSKLFIPYLSQFKATYQKARRSIKKRIIQNKLVLSKQHN